MVSIKGQRVIGEALARAVYDAPLHILRELNKNGYMHTDAMELARRMVRELDHAGWQVKDMSRRNVMTLEDCIVWGLSVSDCKKLASQSPEWQKKARDQAARNICAVLSSRQVVLGRRNAG